MMEFCGAVFNRHGTIDLDVLHPAYGWIPFTASPNDPEAMGRAIYAEAIKGKVAPFIEPILEPQIPLRVSAAQAEIALYRYDEGVLLARINALIDTYPYEPVRIWWRKSNHLDRNHAYLNALAMELDLPDDVVDELFIAADKV